MWEMLTFQTIDDGWENTLKEHRGMVDRSTNESNQIMCLISEGTMQRTLIITHNSLH